MDASVVVKWLFPAAPEEPHTEQALLLLDDIRTGSIEVLQPVHWLAEALAVTTRLAPDVAREAGPLLWAMELPVVDTPEVYQRAVALASELDHHLFDTLYHAVALETPGAQLITADMRYYRKARGRGRLALLHTYRQS